MMQKAMNPMMNLMQRQKNMMLMMMMRLTYASLFNLSGSPSLNTFKFCSHIFFQFAG